MNIKKTAESKTSRNAGNIKKDKIQNLITKGNYQQAEELLQECRRESIEYDDIIAILDAGIGEYYGDRQRVWEAIRKGLMFNIRNYELYVMLGNISLISVMKMPCFIVMTQRIKSRLDSFYANWVINIILM